MKTMMSIRLWILFLGFSSISLTTLRADEVSYTIGKTTVTLSSEPSGKALLANIRNGSSEIAVVAIKDADGVILKEETIQSASKLTKRYDLSQLAEGDYLLSVTKGLIEKVTPFSVTDTGIVIEENKAFEKFSPMITSADNHLDVNLLLPGAGNVSVIITNASGEQVFEETIASDMVFNRRLDIAALWPGDYTVEIKTDDNTFYQDFEVE